MARAVTNGKTIDGWRGAARGTQCDTPCRNDTPPNRRDGVGSRGTRDACMLSMSERSPRILVAEDDAAMRLLIVESLQADGYEVQEAHDGSALLHHVSAANSIDLIVSDIRMPFLSGLQILETLRAEGRTIPVLLMTAFGEDETRAKVEALGAHLLDKPFALSELRTLVRALLTR
jgi:CheY-like chemotaxis protein